MAAYEAGTPAERRRRSATPLALRDEPQSPPAPETPMQGCWHEDPVDLVALKSVNEHLREQLVPEARPL